MSKRILIIAGPNGMKNFIEAYQSLVNEWALYDNAGEEPVLLEWGQNE